MAGRPRLSQSDYVAAAFRVTDQIGLQALTLKALGQHLGVDSTAVYRHFRSKDVLLIAMMDRLLAERLLPSESFTDGRTEVEHVAEVLRSVLMANPPLATAMIATMDLPDSGVRLIERVADGLARMGLSGERLVQHYQMLEYFVLGACMLDSDGSGDEWSVRRRRFEKVPAREFRAVARSADDMQRVADTAYRTGINVLLDACAAAAG